MSDNEDYNDQIVSDVDDFEGSDNDEDSEDLFEQRLFNEDNRADDRLDNYDETLLGDSDEEEVEYGYHQAMAREMDEQDENRSKSRGFLMEQASRAGDDPLLLSQDDLHHLIEPQIDDFPLEDVDIPPDQLFAQPRAPETIKKRFLSILIDCEQNDSLIYEDAINKMAEENKSSFAVDFQDIRQHEPVLAQLLLQAPKEMLALFEEQANELINLRYPNYNLIHEQINVRFTNVGNHVKLVELRHEHMNHFISIHGVVVRRSSIYPKLQTAVYQCVRCNATLPGIQQSLIGGTQLPHLRCPQPDCQSKSLRLNQVHSVFQNFQKLTIQEAPGAVQAGRIPRQVDVVVFDDLIDACTPGEEVEAIGYLQLIPDTHMNRQTGFPIYNTTLVSNNILKKKSKSFAQSGDGLNEFDIKYIHEISQWPNVKDIIIQSIAPSIYGHRDIKTAIASSLFAGVAKELDSKARLRGDINVLLVGDPGVAKSQFLKYTEHIGHRAVYTTGKGASAVGLTATVQRDTMTGEWTLEGGALVLADQGTCLIDEFDKMSDQDRTSIHEAMEQQTISISKAGIVCTLKARCGVIAAANPLGGNYNDNLTFQEQVDLTEPILSRFDILCVVRDKIDRENDERLARFVTGSHMKATPEGYRGSQQYYDENQIDENQVTLEQMRARGFLTQQMLSKYILYARTHCSPTLAHINNEKIISLYKQLRRQAQRTGGIQITPRHLESLLRISEALAKMRLSTRVDDDDVNMAISVVLDSFFQSQKLSVRQDFERYFAQFLFQSYDKHTLVLDALKEAIQQQIQHRQIVSKVSYEIAIKHPVSVKLDTVVKKCILQYGTIDVNGFLTSEVFTQTRGMEYDILTGNIIYTFDDSD